MSADPQSTENTPDRLSGFLRQVVAALRDDLRSDATLLAAFATGDQEAFRVLVGRHGRSVWAACIAQLGDPNDAEDAFQAAFMALARRAGAINVGRRGVGPWVRTAARRAARQLRRAAGRLNRLRTRLHETPPTVPHTPDESETWALAATELDQLPARLREPLVMYHLEGRTLAQVAEALGCSVAEAHRRVERGLEVLRAKLSARGVALTTSILAALPFGLVTDVTAQAAEIARGAELPPRIAALVDAALAPRMPMWAFAVVAAVLACGTAVGFAAWPADAPSAPIRKADLPSAHVADSQKQPLNLVERPTAALMGRVTDAAGKPVPGADVAVLIRKPWLPGDRGLRDEVLVRTIADSEGRYQLDVPADFHTHYPERAVTLMITAPGQPTTTRGLVLKPGVCDVALASMRTVRGVALAPNGKPAEGVRIGVVRLGHAAIEPVQGVMSSLPNGWPAEVISGKDGAFHIAGLPSGESVWLEVRDDRFALTAIRVAPNDTETVKVTLASPRVLHGTVTASDSGKPLAGVRVSVFAGPWESHHDRHTAMTSAASAATDTPPVEFDAATSTDGTFRLRLPPHGPYRVFIHPPAGASYLAIGRAVSWKSDQASHELSVTLPAGEILRGVLKDEQGKPVAGGWVTYGAKSDNRHAPKDMLGGRDAPIRTAPDGSFQLAVPPGPGYVRVRGLHSNFLPATYTPYRCSSCGIDHLRSFEHAHADITVPEGRTPEPLSLTLKSGVIVPGKVVGPDGDPVKSGVMVCRSVVQPLRSLVTRPLLIRDGAFELPGCSAGRMYPVLLLDSEKHLGAVTELKVGGEMPLVKLEPCGTAEVRLVDPAGRPLPSVRAVLALTLDCDRPSSTNGWSAKPGARAIEQSWFDAANYLPGPVTNADGKATLRALVPGAEYAVRFSVKGKWYTSAAFRVKPGQAMRLPDVVAGRVGPSKPKEAEEFGPDDGD